MSSVERTPSNREGFVLEQGFIGAMRTVLERRIRAGHLPADILRQASKKEDEEKGTDFFLFGMPVDITGAPLDMKSCTTKVRQDGIESPDGGLTVDFGLRSGNGKGSFAKPVLVLSIQEKGPVRRNGERNTSRRVEASTMGKAIVDGCFDDVSFVGRSVYNEGTSRKSVHVILPMGTGSAPSRNNGNLIRMVQGATGERWSDIVLYPYVNPRAALVHEVVDNGGNIFVGSMGRKAMGDFQWLSPDRVKKAVARAGVGTRIGSIVT